LVAAVFFVLIRWIAAGVFAAKMSFPALPETTPRESGIHAEYAEAFISTQPINIPKLSAT
jgi:hypothetical protein